MKVYHAGYIPTEILEIIEGLKAPAQAYAFKSPTGTATISAILPGKQNPETVRGFATALKKAKGLEVETGTHPVHNYEQFTIKLK